MSETVNKSKTPVRSETFASSSRHSVILNERNLKMGGHQPVDGRARNDGYQGSLNDGRFGAQMGVRLESGMNVHLY